MKRLLFSFLFLFALLSASCSKEEQAPLPQTLTYTLSFSAEDGGSVSTEGGTYTQGSKITVTATPFSNYLFKNWSDGSTTNPREITVSSDLTLTASFIKKSYPLAITTEGEGVVQEEVIIQGSTSMKEYNAGTNLRLTAVPAEGWVFVEWENGESSNERNITLNNAKSLVAKFEKIQEIQLQLEQKLELFRGYERLVNVLTVNGKTIQRLFLPVNDENFESTDIYITPIESGIFDLVIEFNGVITTEAIEILPFQVNELNEEGDNQSIVRIPVVIINFMPTEDGFNLDFSKIGYQNSAHLTVEDVENTLDFKRRYLEYAIKEGSRFRGYKNLESISYASVFPLKSYNFFELPLKSASWNSAINEPDYQRIFELIDLEMLVNELGVKEVWFYISPLYEGSPSYSPSIHSSDNFYVMPESNMSSPTTSDISNSFRNNSDLPIYKSTYVVYGFVYNSSVSNDLHIRGHQIEAQLRYVKGESSREFFDNFFVGNKEDGFRVGNVHFPPNGQSDYDYANIERRQSDILDWIPSGGELNSINRDLWYNQDYQWPEGFKDYQGSWLLFWYQSIPGYQNSIPYLKNGVEYSLTNWWEIFYNWDQTILESKSLWE